LKNEQDMEFTDHESKAAILWKSFKGRLGQTRDTSWNFDLQSMITPQDLSMVEAPFSNEEIDNIIKHMPNDKAPGPDGFNGLL
jgi:hypothetical protein